MAEIIQRIFRGKVRAVDTEKFTVEAVVSDESIDSYNEIILADAWSKGLKRYKSHPVLLSSHRYGDLTSQIGTGKKIGVDQGELVTLFQYFVGEGNAQADWGFKLAEKGLAAFSVGFIPKSTMDDTELEEFSKGRKVKPRRVYKEVELLEISQVVIPANANALQKGVEDEDPVIKTLADEISQDEVVKSLVLVSKGWEETDNEIRHRIRNPGDFQKDSFRYITLKKTKPVVNAIIGKLKGEDTTTIQSLRFPKADGWTMADAKEWVKAHPVKDVDGMYATDEGIQVDGADPDMFEFKEVLEVKEAVPAWGKEMLSMMKKMLGIMTDMTGNSGKAIQDLSEQVEVLEDRITELDHSLNMPPADTRTTPIPDDVEGESYVKKIFDSLKQVDAVLKPE